MPKRKVMPKVLKAWWSESYAKSGEKMALNALTADATGRILKFQIYEFRRRSKIIKEVNIPVPRPEVHAKWKVAYKPEAAECGNPEFRFKAAIGKHSKTSKTLYVPVELEIALTFDDGPAPRENPRTEHILNVLSRNKIKATFFVEHSNILDKYRQGLLQRMVKDGHIVGVHGVDPVKHHLPHQDTPEIEGKLKSMRDLIKGMAGSYPIFIRPPYGWGGWEKGRLWNKPQLRKMYEKFNMVRVNGWEAEVGKLDFWKNVEERIEKAAKGNMQKLIILAHDLREYDAANLSEIIKVIQTKATKFKTKVKYLTLREFY